MIQLASVFQFVFLYLPILFIGMAVYGTNIKSASGYAYIAVILLISLLLGLLKRQKYPPILLRLSPGFALLGGIGALYLYRQLHFNFWDEHSLQQSLLVAFIGLSACISSITSSIKKPQRQTEPVNVFIVLSLFSIIWLIAVYYPMAAFLFIGLILIFSALFENSSGKTDSITPASFSRYFVFLLFVDLPLVIWDYQVNTLWAAYVAASLLACALGYLLADGQKRMGIAMIAFGLNFIYCIIQPDYVLNPLHSMISGLVLGMYIHTKAQQNKASLLIAPAMAAPAMLGFMVGLLFYSNLSYGSWRGLLLLPPLIFFVYQSFRQSRTDNP